MFDTCIASTSYASTESSASESCQISQSDTSSNDAHTPKPPTKKQLTIQQNKEVAAQIQLGHYITEKKKLCRKNSEESQVWDVFRLVRDRKTRSLVNAAQCSKCLKVFKYVDGAGGTGTSTMGRHLTTCEGSPAVYKTFEDKLESSAEAKQEFTVAVARWCAFKSASPELMIGPAAVQLSQQLIDFGVTYGRINAESLLRHPQTVRKYMSEEATKAREAVVKEVLPYIQAHQCAATTDGWTRDHSKDHDLALTIHYINEEWILINRLLFILPLPPDEAATAESQRAALKRFVEEMGIPPDFLEEITWVCDGGADIVKALEVYNRLYCIAHALNVVVRTALCVKYHTLVQRALESSVVARRIISECNRWVKEVRPLLPKSKGNALLHKSLRVSNEISQGHVPPLRSYVQFHFQVRTITLINA